MFGYPGDVFDGLHLCAVCRDVETRGDVCSRCREQEAIDAGSGMENLGHVCSGCDNFCDLREQYCHDCLAEIAQDDWIESQE